MNNIFHSTSSLIHGATTFYICYSLTEKNGWNRVSVLPRKTSDLEDSSLPCCGSNLQNSRPYTGWKALGLLANDQEWEGQWLVLLRNIEWTCFHCILGCPCWNACLPDWCGISEVCGPRGHNAGAGYVGAFSEPGMLLYELIPSVHCSSNFDPFWLRPIIKVHFPSQPSCKHIFITLL